MLTLFADTLDLTDPTGDGWIVITSLVKSLNKESVPMTDISVNWLLRLTSSEHVVAFGARSIWDGLQHAVRSFLFHEASTQVLRRLLDLDNSHNGGKGEGSAIAESQITALSHWLALRASQQELLPMVIEAGRFLKMEGYDWVQDGITPREYVRALPAIYAAWTTALPNGIERFNQIVEFGLDRVLASLSLDRELLRGAIQVTQRHEHRGDHGENSGPVAKRSSSRHICRDCEDSYIRLGMGLVQPRRITFEECRKIGHRKDCECRDFLEEMGVESQGEYTTPAEEVEDDDVDEEFVDAVSEQDVLGQLCEAYDKLGIDDPKIDPFEDAATLLYRAQARKWLGTYRPEDLLCATCFLKRERYIGGDAQWTEFDYTPMPETYGAYAAGYVPTATL
jgi:hypothetical protein